MNRINRHTVSIAGLTFLFALMLGFKAHSQCSVVISTMSAGSGQVNFTTTITNITGTPSYTWNFGSSGIPPLSGTAAGFPSVTYTTSGYYVVNVSVTTGTCVTSTSVQIAVAICSIIFTQTPTTGSLCTGSATPIITGLCPPLSYAWSSGHNSMVDTSMCAQLYSVVISGANSPTCCPFITGFVNIQSSTVCPLSASFSTTAQQNGNVQFTSSSSGTNLQTLYKWYFGDGSLPVSGVNLQQVSHSYTSNNTYTPSLVLFHNSISSCKDSTAHSISVTNYSPCTVSASYSTSASSASVNFVSTSTGTNPATLYTWHFGDGSQPLTSNSPTATHVYTNTGVYKHYLVASNKQTLANCIDSTALDSVLIAGCLLQSDFTATQVNVKTMQFVSTSVFTNSNTVYSWNFGDGQVATGPIQGHVYSTGGVYTVSLLVKNDTICLHTKLKAIIVDSTACTLSSAFLHTVGASGVVHYSAVPSSGSYDYFWDFGDGTSAIIPNLTHTYVTGGNHYVMLEMAEKQRTYCHDSLIMAINVTGIPCVANSGFSLVPTSTPKYWTAIPDYPYNVTAAKWSWGDGFTSSTLYTSHIYSASAVYSICLSVTVSCGDTSTTCGNYSIYKSPSGGADFYYVNVAAPPLKVAVIEESPTSLEATLYPNPTQAILNIRLVSDDKSSYRVSDLSGRVLLTGNLEQSDETQIDLGSFEKGIYLVEIRSKGQKKVSRILVTE